jgi:hypothetical protein
MLAKIFSAILAIGSLCSPSMTYAQEKVAVDDKCCEGQYAKCMSFCESPEGKKKGAGCPQACSERAAACNKTGLYYWRTSPTITCKK